MNQQAQREFSVNVLHINGWMIDFCFVIVAVTETLTTGYFVLRVISSSISEVGQPCCHLQTVVVGTAVSKLCH